MILPDGVSFHGLGYKLGPGDELPDEVIATFPPDHPLRQAQKQAPRAAPRPTDDKGK